MHILSFLLIFCRGLFSSAQTGSVSLAKSKFERQTTSPTPPVRQKSTTPFRSTAHVPRSPSPVHPPNTTTTTTLRKRSPSPVQTGAVNRVRCRFESTPAAGGTVETSANGQHQTLPKTFKPGGGALAVDDVTAARQHSGSMSLSTTVLTQQPSTPLRLQPSGIRNVDIPVKTSQLQHPSPDLRTKRQQDLIHDAAAFLSQKLPTLSTSPAATTKVVHSSPKVGSKVIRGPFGYADL